MKINYLPPPLPNITTNPYMHNRQLKKIVQKPRHM